MTDKPSSTSQPSMEDILASIRRIINDDDGAAAPSAPAKEVAESPQESSSFSIDEDAAALARAEYDAAMGREDQDVTATASEEESIFPQRDGALWRRVAGYPLSEGETDPLPADDTLELTEVLDTEVLDSASILPDVNESAFESSELLDSSEGASAAETDQVLDAMLSDPAEQAAPAGALENDDSSLGIGAVTAAGLGAAGTLGATASGFFNPSESPNHADGSQEEEDDVLDLTRGMEVPGSIEKLASSLGDNPIVKDDGLPPVVFERVDVEPLDAGQEHDLDRTFETASVTGLTDEYVASITPIDGDYRERALDERFYDSDEFAGMPPEISGTYSSSSNFENDAPHSRHEGAPTEDEMETVGGLVRDALRSRLPSGAPSSSEPDPLVSGGTEESAARSLASLAQYDSHAPRRIYGGIKITDDEDSPTIEGVVQDTLRPMLREWLNDNLPTLVESMVKQEVERISARSRQFVRDDKD